MHGLFWFYQDSALKMLWMCNSVILIRIRFTASLTCRQIGNHLCDQCYSVTWHAHPLKIYIYLFPFLYDLATQEALASSLINPMLLCLCAFASAVSSSLDALSWPCLWQDTAQMAPPTGSLLCFPQGRVGYLTLPCSRNTVSKRLLQLILSDIATFVSMSNSGDNLVDLCDPKTKFIADLREELSTLFLPGDNSLSWVLT